MTCELHLVQMYILPSWFAISVSVPFSLRMAQVLRRYNLLAPTAPLLTPKGRRAFLQEGIDPFPPVLRRLQ